MPSGETAISTRVPLIEGVCVPVRARGVIDRRTADKGQALSLCKPGGPYADAQVGDFVAGGRDYPEMARLAPLHDGDEVGGRADRKGGNVDEDVLRIPRRDVVVLQFRVVIDVVEAFARRIEGDSIGNGDLLRIFGLDPGDIGRAVVDDRRPRSPRSLSLPLYPCWK